MLETWICPININFYLTTFAAARVRVRPRGQLPELRAGAGGRAHRRVQAQLRKVAPQRGVSLQPMYYSLIRTAGPEMIGSSIRLRSIPGRELCRSNGGVRGVKKLHF